MFRIRLLLLSLSLAAAPAWSSDTSLILAESAGRWIADTEVTTDYGPAWPDDALKPGVVTYSYGSGVAGKVAFFIALHRATGKPEYAEQARKGGDYLLRVLADETAFDENPRRASLYTGIAGVGLALQRLHELTNETKYEEGLRLCLTRLQQWSVREEPGSRWSDTFNDLLFGDSGTILFLADVGARTGNKEAIALAASGADFIVSQAQTDEVGYYWLFRRDKNFNLPNFSHGTAGIAYTLATLGELTDNAHYTNAALEGFAYLSSIAIWNDGAIAIPYGYGADHWDGLYEFGWAHGLAGSLKLFLRLEQLGLESKVARQFIEATVTTLVVINQPGNVTAPFAEPSLPGDFRFGRAGVLDGLAAAETTPASARVQQYLLEYLWNSSESDNGKHWWQVEAPAFMGGGPAQYTGVMHGAAGIGLALLRMHAQDQGKAAYIELPDGANNSEASLPRTRRHSNSDRF